ncbi:MAG: flavodoxin family protein [Chloroflexi bacterium]|nr:flavodoxin family protein [Chloroflexota bacterium]
MSVRVLGIGGSHRVGNADALLSRAMEGVACRGVEVELVLLRHLRIEVCGMCDEHCNRTGTCPLNDGMQGLYGKLRQANGLILASPIYFRSVSAQTKLMVDRCQTLWATKHLLHRPVSDAPTPRPGVFIAVSNQEKPQEYPGALTVVKSFFATLDFDYAGELLVGGMDWAGEVQGHPDQLERAFKLGVELARLAQQSAG